MEVGEVNMPICTLIFFIQILRKFASSTMRAKEVCGDESGYYFSSFD